MKRTTRLFILLACLVIYAIGYARIVGGTLKDQITIMHVAAGLTLANLVLFVVLVMVLRDQRDAGFAG